MPCYHSWMVFRIKSDKDGFGRYGENSFITQWGTYCYKVMSFGLMNVGATYQRTTTTLLHDLIHKEVEVYVDDTIVKSKDRERHMPALQKFFERIQFYKL